jgi:hypothetical protein
MTQHARLRIDTGLAVYFCVPTVRGSAARTRAPTGSCARAGDKKPAVTQSAPPIAASTSTTANQHPAHLGFAGRQMAFGTDPGSP